MRTAHHIQNHFSTEFLAQYQHKMNDFRLDIRLSTAMKILNIDESKFECFPFKKDRKAFLQYKFWLSHFEVSPGKYPEAWQENLLQFKGLIVQAEKIVANVLEQHVDQYSPFAQGLSTLHQRRGKHAAAAENNLDGLLASVVIVGKKTGGIEPGFIAAHHQDLVEYLLTEFAEKDLLKLIDDVQGNIDVLLERYADKLPKYMYKMDYHTDAKKLGIRGKTPVYLTEEDVRRTSNVQNAYKLMPFIGDLAAKGYVVAKQSTSGAINSDALKETLANDFASIFMPVQEQKLYQTVYPNGDKKFMPCSRWVDGASEFGSRKAPLIDGYPCRKLLQTQAGIAYLRDDSIKNLSRYYLLLLLTGDYDKVGSLGQNLLKIVSDQDEKTGKKLWTLVGIDFGHTFREKSRVLQYLLADGRFEQPVSHPFKNFSALADGRLREKIEGLLILAKLAGKCFPETVIDSYGEDFKKTWAAIQSKEAERLCENYWQALDNLANLDYDNHMIYMDLKKDVRDFQEIMREDLAGFLQVFDNYLGREASLIDLMDNLNTFSAGLLNKTTLRSENNQTLLRHMLIKADYKHLWRINYHPENHCYRLEYTNPSQEILQALEGIFSQQGLSRYCSFNHEGSALTLGFHESDLSLIANKFNEQVVQKEIHPQEYFAIQSAEAELALQDLTKAPWFLKQQVQIDLCPHQGAYRLLIAVKGNQDDLTALILSRMAMEFSLSGVLEMTFGREQLPEVLKQLSTIPQAYEDLHLQDAEVKALNPGIYIKVLPQSVERPVLPELPEKKSAELENNPEAEPERESSMVEKSLAFFSSFRLFSSEQKQIPDTVKPEESEVESDFHLLEKEETKLEILLKYYEIYQSNKETRSEGDSASHWMLWASTKVSDTYNYYANPCSSISLGITLKLCVFPENGQEPDMQKLLELLEARKKYIEQYLETSAYKKELFLIEEGITEIKTGRGLNP